MRRSHQSTWTEIIESIFENEHREAKKNHLRNIDHSVTLPKSLSNRVRKIVNYEFDAMDRVAFMDESDEDEKSSYSEIYEEEEDEVQEKKADIQKHSSVEDIYNESSCSEILRMEKEFRCFQPKHEKPNYRIQYRKKKQNNRFSKYISKPNRERIVWQSKVNKELSERTVDELADEIINATSERFVDFLTSISKNPSNLTKEVVKQIFWLDGESTLFNAINTDPKEIYAIPQTVAEKWDMRELATEVKYEDYINNRLRNIPQHTTRVAFGSTIHTKDLPWHPTNFNDDKISTVFPDDLISGQNIFVGIRKLRVIQHLGDFYRKHKNFEIPSYLGKTFADRTSRASTKSVRINLFNLSRMLLDSSKSIKSKY